MENHGNVTILWQAFSGAKEYYVYINGQKTSTTPYTGASATLDNVAVGDIIEIKAYSDFDEKVLIATGTYTYEVDNSNSFSVYVIKYFDKIEYISEEESFHEDKTKYKRWKLTSSTNSNMSMVIGVSSANSNGTQIKNATYNLGKSSGYANGGATILIADKNKAEGWPLKSLDQGTVKIEGSTSTGCTVTISNGNDQNDFGTAFNGTAVVKF